MTVAELIAQRHSDDLIVDECKDGPTYGGSHSRLDWWVLRSSWSRPAMIGYELKSSRSDFLRDMKWPSYLPLCNELWFIDNGAKIKPEELPKEVGLLRAANTRFTTLRRAVWREIAFPEDLARYVLMCRTKIKPHWQDKRGVDDAGYWREWLEQKHEHLNLGRSVSKKMAATVQRFISDVQRENDRLRQDCDRLGSLRAALDAKGINWRGWEGADEIVAGLTVGKWDRQRVAAVHELLGELLNGKAGER